MSSGSRSALSARSQPVRPTPAPARSGGQSAGARLTPLRAVRPSARAVQAQRAKARRTRRLRLLGVLVFVVVAAFFAVQAARPLFQRAIRDLTLPLRYSAIIDSQAQAKQLDPALVAAVIYAETGFDARTSSAGAVGLMQLEPATAEALARQSGATTFRLPDLGTPAVNIAYGAYYLRQLLNTFGGDETAALAAYNGGETNVGKWIARAHSEGHAFGMNDIPFPATRAYVEKVESAQREYRQKYGRQLGLS